MTFELSTNALETHLPSHAAVVITEVFDFLLCELFDLLADESCCPDRYVPSNDVVASKRQNIASSTKHGCCGLQIAPLWLSRN